MSRPPLLALILCLGLTATAAAQEARPPDLDAALRDLALAEPAFALLEDMQDDRARQLLEERLREDPDSVAATIGLARQAARRKLFAGESGPLVGELQERMSRGDIPALIALVEYWFIDSAEDSGQAGQLIEVLERARPGSAWAVYLRVRLLNRQAKRAEAERLLRALLVREPGSLTFWNMLPDTRPNHVELAGALAVLKDSPLAPRVHLRLAQQIPDPKERWRKLIELEGRFATSPYWDDIRMTRVNTLQFTQVAERIRLMEGVVEHGPSGQLSIAAGQLATYYLLADEPRKAYDCLKKAGERASPHQLHECLMALEDYTEAEANAVRMVEAAEERLRSAHPSVRAEASFTGGVSRAHLCLADALTGQERYADALGLYFEHLRAIDVDHGRWFVLALVAEHPLALLGGFLFCAEWMFALVVSAFVVFRHVRRIRPFGHAVLAIALPTALAHLGVILYLGEVPGPLDTFSVLSALGAGLLLVGAGTYLLRTAGVHLGPSLVRRRTSPLRVALSIGAALALMVAVSAALYAVHPPRLSPFFERMRAFFPEGKLSVLLEPGEERLLPATLAVLAAVQEEILFRGLLLGLFLTSLRRLLGRRRRLLSAAIAVALTSLLWALPHGGVVDPEWWKMAQVTLLGGVLGALCLRTGLLPAILAHALFNLAAVLLQ